MNAREKYAREEVARDYERRRFRGLRGSTLDRRERAALVRALARAPGSGGVVLDVPCGTGRFLGTLAGAGFRPVGADTSRAMIERSPRDLDGLGLVRADAGCLPVRTASVAGAVCVRLMHHLSHPERVAVLRELARVARRFAVVNYYHRHSFKNLLRTAGARLRGSPSRARNRLTRGEIETEVGLAGLRVVEIFPVTRFWSERLMVLAEPRPTEPR